MLPLPPDFLAVSYRADLQVLVARWMRVISVEEMRQGYELLLAAAVQHNCRHWLIDARRRNNTDREGAIWMVQSFLPRLHGQLGGRTALAYLLPPVQLRDTQADAAFPPASYFEGQPFVADRFTDERLALEWLRQPQ
jgi:hypothetical protein